MPKQVDVIIPVHNRLEHTKQTLESFFANTSPELATLYIVNDGSDQETSDYLAANADKFELFINMEAIGPAASRNKVAQIITQQGKRNAYLYHSDNDVYFKEGWLELLLKAFESLNANPITGVKLLGGGCHPYLKTSAHLFASDDPYYRIGQKDAVSGYSQLMSWETWDKYGPFDENQGSQDIKIMGSEDWAFCQRIIKDGFNVAAIEPELVIHTGKTNTYGKPATGVETFNEIEGVLIK